MAHAGGAAGPPPSSTISMISAQDAHAMYKALGQLGEGAFSEVFRVENKKTNKISAMKRFKKRFETQKEVDSLREIQALKRLNPHPHIVILEQVIFDPKSGILCLTFEVMENNLYTILARKGQILPEALIKKYFYQVCKGLEFMHSKGIFHRDIKPENILVREIDGVVKIADFGSCRGIHSKAPYTEYIATRWYRSPECLLCKGLYNYKLDIWGAGCVLYEVITKHPLFPGKNEMDQLQKIHNIMGSPTQKMLKKIGGALGFRINYNFPHQEGTGLVGLANGKCSPECVALVQALLMYDPEERITAKQAVRHPWFAEYNPAPVTVPAAPLPAAIAPAAMASISPLSLAATQPVQPVVSVTNIVAANATAGGSTSLPVGMAVDARKLALPSPLTLALSPDMGHANGLQPNGSGSAKDLSPSLRQSLNSLALGNSPLAATLPQKIQELYSPSSLVAAENANKKRRSNVDIAQQGSPIPAVHALDLATSSRSVHNSHRSLVIPEPSVLHPQNRSSIQNVHLSPTTTSLGSTARLVSMDHVASTTSPLHHQQISPQHQQQAPAVAAASSQAMQGIEPSSTQAAAVPMAVHEPVAVPAPVAEAPAPAPPTHVRRRSIVENVLGVFGRQSHLNRASTQVRARRVPEKRTTMILPQIQPLWKKLAPSSYSQHQQQPSAQGSTDAPSTIQDIPHRQVEPLPKSISPTRKDKHPIHLPKLGSPDSHRTTRREEHTGK